MVSLTPFPAPICPKKGDKCGRKEQVCEWKQVGALGWLSPFLHSKVMNRRIPSLAVPHGARMGQLLPLWALLSLHRGPQAPALHRQTGGWSPSLCFPPIGLNIPLLPSPSLLTALCARFAMDKKRAVAGQARGRESLWRLGGGRDCGVQTQPGRVIRDLACRAAWSCGRVWKCLYTLDSFSFPKFSVSGSAYF